ncbi:NAD(P)-dependent oxidoreductase [Geodermatophilus sabuli]|uniref:3-hydroxyisobutyrate dehydrogenase/putative dehydrogenase n=1 Tax=Geodermatophilus sabuli TaxID=1564158 RepID=A0A285E6R8_9ACTN|nr:NAD(P)-binding domain-containing protein [Geodermatophilus sabuli]MBB3082470.1 3-hydroxyisobutyrate dehydrogenase-like beta-hydroxyacid dehydrogenase [Geodermatophilus sabuli]SNX94660.1 3-hydroxyisobutyrate dehydrogenase/putative dehydrogenase [Geodermatophilus sabuli]
MHLAIGLGPIGGNIGAHLAELGRRVHGYDLNADRVREWSAETDSPAGDDLAAVDWPAVESVHVAVRTADQVSSAFGSLQHHAAQPLTVFVHTTLAPGDARRVLSSAPDSWRVFEAPVSGGPQGARQGTMTIFLAGPAPTDTEESLLADTSGRVFRMQSYGQPALVKLLNNALATYNLTATARMLNLAAELGVPAKDFFEVIGVSTGQSWMSDNLIDVQYDLLLKDVGLLRGEIPSLPTGDLDDDVEQAVLRARELLGTGPDPA